MTYLTARLPRHKINIAIVRQETCHRQEGAVQIDDASRGGARVGSDAGRRVYDKLDLVRGSTSQSIGNWATACLTKARATSIGRGRFADSTGASYLHVTQVSAAHELRNLPELK